ncbi:hypothetical protein GMRT_13930 [Giardia muris]|uniref:Uncharacterized protein n=1 Tax=Giardia muris TaxID=5742 RepID=A0A4Z1SLG5_GIAMU|nr:hypothetical protein GMRT_13930 [Giardia muris]|eukprot:TNJ26486.1 hypothetical protein GMRT_13930 [Giardia muris]
MKSTSQHARSHSTQGGPTGASAKDGGHDPKKRRVRVPDAPGGKPQNLADRYTSDADFQRLLAQHREGLAARGTSGTTPKHRASVGSLRPDSGRLDKATPSQKGSGTPKTTKAKKRTTGKSPKSSRRASVGKSPGKKASQSEDVTSTPDNLLIQSLQAHLSPRVSQLRHSLVDSSSQHSRVSSPTIYNHPGRTSVNHILVRSPQLVRTPDSPRSPRSSRTSSPTSPHVSPRHRNQLLLDESNPEHGKLLRLTKSHVASMALGEELSIDYAEQHLSPQRPLRTRSEVWSTHRQYSRPWTTNMNRSSIDTEQERFHELRARPGPGSQPSTSTNARCSSGSAKLRPTSARHLSEDEIAKATGGEFVRAYSIQTIQYNRCPEPKSPPVQIPAQPRAGEYPDLIGNSWVRNDEQIPLPLRRQASNPHIRAGSTGKGKSPGLSIRSTTSMQNGQPTYTLDGRGLTTRSTGSQPQLPLSPEQVEYSSHFVRTRTQGSTGPAGQSHAKIDISPIVPTADVTPHLPEGPAPHEKIITTLSADLQEILRRRSRSHVGSAASLIDPRELFSESQASSAVQSSTLASSIVEQEPKALIQHQPSKFGLVQNEQHSAVSMDFSTIDRTRSDMIATAIRQTYRPRSSVAELEALDHEVGQTEREDQHSGFTTDLFNALSRQVISKATSLASSLTDPETAGTKPGAPV